MCMLICYPILLVVLPHLISSALPLVLQIILMVWGWWFLQILPSSFLLLFHNGLVLLYLRDLFKSFPNIWREFCHKQWPTLPLSLWSFASFCIFVSMEDCLCSVCPGILFFVLILPAPQPPVCLWAGGLVLPGFFHSPYVPGLPHAQGFPGASHSEESACNTGDLGSIPGPRRSPGGRNGNPLQCSCLLNPMDREAWWDSVHGVTVRHNGATDAFNTVFTNGIPSSCR